MNDFGRVIPPSELFTCSARTAPRLQIHELWIGFGFPISCAQLVRDVDSTQRTGSLRGRRGPPDRRADVRVIGRPSLKRRASRAQTDQGSRPWVSVLLVRMRLIDSGPEILPLGSCIRDGLADRAHGQRSLALLVQPLSERIQKRYRVPLPDHAPRPAGGSVARVGRIDRSVVLRAVLTRSRSFRRGLVGERQVRPSKPDPLDLVEVDLVASAVVELARIRRIAAGDGSGYAPRYW
jgi:hypothetical protein